jgi:hypothetical protein
MRAVHALVLAVLASAACAKGIPLPGDTSTVKIPAGQYTIGGGPATCPAQNGSCSTTPARPVSLSQAYDIEAREVTVRQYEACAELGFCCGDASNSNYADEGDLPAEVRIDQARQYCKHRNRRLPTEAEWEVAARLKDASGTLQAYPWGDTPPNCGQVPSQDCGSGNRELKAVGTNPFDKTPLGIYDMAGSVPEWVEDDFAIGIGCRYQFSTANICSGDGTCMANLCDSPGGCQEECAGSAMNLGCSSSDPNNGQSCPVIPANEAQVDPFFVAYDHATQAPASGCQQTSTSSSRYPMYKGGGVFEPSCAQNPAARNLEQGFGVSVNGGSSGRQLGFRCVKTGSSSSLPRPTGTARYVLNAAPACGQIQVVSPPPDTPPKGWGTEIHVALGSELGWATGKYDAGKQAYVIDLNDRLAFPGSPCPMTNSQPSFNNMPVLVLAGVPITSFGVQISYPAANGSATCTVSYQQTVNLLGYQGPCAIDYAPSSARCP